MDNIVRKIHDSLSYVVLTTTNSINVPCSAHYSTAISFDVDETEAILPTGTKIFAEIDCTKDVLDCNLLSNKLRVIENLKEHLYNKYSVCCEKSEFVVDAIKLQIDKSMLPLFDVRSATENDLLDVWCK